MLPWLLGCRLIGYLRLGYLAELNVGPIPGPAGLEPGRVISWLVCVFGESFPAQGHCGQHPGASPHRVNDWLLRINDVDLVNKDKKQALKALLLGDGAINMVVRRRKSLGGKVVTPLHISLGGQKGGQTQGPPLWAGWAWRGWGWTCGNPKFLGVAWET